MTPPNPDQLPTAPCIASVDNRIGEMEIKLNEIHSALVGNKALGHRGLVDRVEHIEKKVENHDRKLIAWGGITVGAMAVFEAFKGKLFGL